MFSVSPAARFVKVARRERRESSLYLDTYTERRRAAAAPSGWHSRFRTSSSGYARNPGEVGAPLLVVAPPQRSGTLTDEPCSGACLTRGLVVTGGCGEIYPPVHRLVQVLLPSDAVPFESADAKGGHCVGRVLEVLENVD